MNEKPISILIFFKGSFRGLAYFFFKISFDLHYKNLPKLVCTLTNWSFLRKINESKNIIIINLT